MVHLLPAVAPSPLIQRYLPPEDPRPGGPSVPRRHSVQSRNCLRFTCRISRAGSSQISGHQSTASASMFARLQVRVEVSGVCPVLDVAGLQPSSLGRTVGEASVWIADHPATPRLTRRLRL